MSKRFKNRTDNALKERELSSILNFPEKMVIQVEENTQWQYYF